MLELCPMTLKEAKAFVEQHHRHHKPVVGHKFSIGCTDGEKIVGVAIAIGKCNECRFLKQCESDRNFTFPADAYCQKRKQEILKEWG